MAAVTSPGMLALATNSLSRPVATSRLMRTTRPSLWSPTASWVPALLMENWRGLMPPAGAVCTSLRLPLVWSME